MSCAAEMRKDSRQHLPLVLNRAQFLETICSRHERVAHIGCADSPYTRHRLRTGQLLHSRLVQSANVTGFDIDPEGLAELKQLMPGERFIQLDLTRDIPNEHSGIYDLVVASEVMEHVADIGRFLDGCRRLLASGGELCVTVPNACSPKVGMRAFFGTEIVHPDHLVYFSPRTLTRCLAMAGFSTTYVATYLAPPSLPGRVTNGVLQFGHRLRHGPIGDGLIAIAHVLDSSG